LAPRRLVAVSPGSIRPPSATPTIPPARAQLASTGSPERQLGLIALALAAAGIALLALAHYLGKAPQS
jgi:hypothetical protein